MKETIYHLNRLKQADIENNQTYSKREPNGQKRLPISFLLKLYKITILCRI